MKASILSAALLGSLVATFSGLAVAGSMAATPIAIDKSTAPDVISLPDVTVTFGNNLTYQDDIILTLTGADVTVGVPMPSADCVVAGQPSFPVGYVAAGLNAWNFRVASTSGIAIGDTCTFRNLKITRASLGSSCEVKASYSAKRFQVGSVIDSAGPITVATVTPCGPPPPPPPPPPPANTALMHPVDLTSAFDDGPQDGVFDRLYGLDRVIDNNGWTSAASALEFDLSAIPADARVTTAMVGFEIGVWEGVRALAIGAYDGDGVVTLPDFTAGSIVGRPSIAAPGTRPVALDVTSQVTRWVNSGVRFGGFNLREDPPHCCGYTMMSVARSALVPVLAVMYEPVRIVGLDVRPGTEPNNVNLRSAGVLPVAILSGSTFYAPTDVVLESIRFGHAGSEASLERCSTEPEDVNLDGLMDLVCRFRTVAAGFVTGDTQGVLRAETVKGERLKAVDSIRIVP